MDKSIDPLYKKGRHFASLWLAISIGRYQLGQRPAGRRVVCPKGPELGRRPSLWRPGQTRVPRRGPGMLRGRGSFQLCHAGDAPQWIAGDAGKPVTL